MVVVSEENRQISLVERARIVRNLSEGQLARALTALLDPSAGRRSILGFRPATRSGAIGGGRAPRLTDLGRAVRRRPKDSGPAARSRLGPAGRRSGRDPRGPRSAVTRVLSFITHNWPLKVAAVALASLLYVGLVLAQNSKETRVQIPIDVRNQPAQTAYLSGVQYVTSIRYFAPADLASRIGSDAFTAWIDLASTIPDSSNDIVVKVNVSTADPQIQVLDWTPRQISVRLDPLTSKTVPVQVDSGTKPPGLDRPRPDRRHFARSRCPAPSRR